MTDGENNKINPTVENESDSFFQSILKLSVKTLFYLLLIITVFAAAVSQAFPLTAMRFYADMEDYQTAVRYAKVQAERGGKNRLEALFEGVKISEELLFTADCVAESETAAEYILYFTQEIVRLNDFNDRCADLDEYYRQNAASTPAKVGLYSFKDYLFCLNTAANSVLGKADKLMYDGGYTPLEEKGYITQDELFLMFCKIADINNNYIPYAELAVIFNQISENIIWGGGSLIFDYKSDRTTGIYDMLLLCIQGEDGYGYLNKVLSLEDKSIRRLYFLRAAAMLCENIKAFFGSLTDWEYRNEKIDEVKDVFSILIDDEIIPIYDFYRLELASYK